MVIQAKDIDFDDSNYNIAGSQTVLEPAEPNAGEVVELEEGEDVAEMEIDEDAILYYIEDEEGNEVGFAVEENGEVVEYHYADEDGECACCGHDHDAEELLDMEVDEDAIEYYIEDEDGNEIGFAVKEGDEVVEYFYAEDEAEELIDMEVDEECIEYYIEDEAGNEIGFAVNEDGQVVEYYYAEDEAPAAAPAAAAPAPKKDQGIIGDIRSQTDKALNSIENKLDNGEMSEGTKKMMAGAMDAADTMREIKGTLKDFKEAFSFKI